MTQNLSIRAFQKLRYHMRLIIIIKKSDANMIAPYNIDEHINLATCNETDILESNNNLTKSYLSPLGLGAKKKLQDFDHVLQVTDTAKKL